MKKIFVMLFSLCFLLWVSLAWNYTSEQQEAYKFAYDKTITTVSSIDKADMNGSLTRIAMAKMISNFAINVLWLKPDTSVDCSFWDVSKDLDSQYNLWVTQACQLWLMWIWNDWKKSDKFDPKGVVTRAQFATAFSRALNKSKWTSIENWNPYYTTHLQYLYSEWIIKSVSNPSPSTVEKRWNVMIMMMRASNKDGKDTSTESKNSNDNNNISEDELIWHPEYYHDNLTVYADIWLDWNVDVTEDFITYFNVNKHWIIRSIPLDNWKISISDVFVEWKKFITYTEWWAINIKIWDADKYVNWVQNYSINYNVNWLIKEFSDHSELVWNIVWDEFDTKFEQVSAYINLPRGYVWFSTWDILISIDWVTKPLLEFAWVDTIYSTIESNRITFDYRKWLSAYHWITIAIKFPKGFFDEGKKVWGENLSLMTQENLLKLKEKGVIRWNKDAKITILEFTELLCPYCKRQSNEWIIESLLNKYPDDVNSISKFFIVHWEPAFQLSLAMDCVGSLNPWVYYDVLDGAFKAYPVDLDGLINIAVDKWISMESLQKCIDKNKWEYSKFVNDSMSLCGEFWVNWTPWNIIINNETKKYVLVLGAYPIETFEEAIEALLD